MASVNVQMGAGPKQSTQDLIEQARTIKHMLGQDGGVLSFMEVFGPSGNAGIDAIAEIREVRGWNWTAILAKSLQFVQADISVFLREDLAEQINQYDPTIQRSADQGTLQGQDIPENYVPAPDAHIIRSLMSQPNPWTSEEFFKFDFGMQIFTHGVCHILVLPTGDGLPLQMYIIPKAMIWPVGSTKESPEGAYRVGRLNRWFMGSGKRDNTEIPKSLHEMHAWLSDKEYPAKYVLSIGMPSLVWRDDFSNPSKAIADTLFVERKIQESRKATLEGQMSSSPVLKEREGVTLSPDEKEQHLADFERNWIGAANEGRAKWKPENYEIDNSMSTAREMEYSDASIEQRDAILGQHMVPPSVVGLGDTAGFAGVVGLAKTWAMFSGQPMMDLMSGQLTTGLRSFFEAPLDEFLIKIQTGRIDDAQVEETKLMNDVTATIRTVGEFRDARKLPRFGDERDNAMCGTLGAGAAFGNAMDGLGAAAEGDDADTSAGIGAAEQPEAAEQAKGEMSEMSRLQQIRNSKGIMDILDRYSKGTVKRKVAIEFLNMLGVDRTRAESLLEDEVVAEPEELAVIHESASVVKAFGPPISSGLPYLLCWFDEYVEQALSDWQEILSDSIPEASPTGRPHLTLYGPVIDAKGTAEERIRDVCREHGAVEAAFETLTILRQDEYDVVAIKVTSPDAEALFAKLNGEIPSPIKSHGFKAHVSLAYVPKGSADSFEGANLAGVTLTTVVFDHATYGTRDGQAKAIELDVTVMPVSTATAPVVSVTKSLGMDTTSAENGGVLVATAPAKAKDTNDEESFEDPDENEDPWFEKAQAVIEQLDNLWEAQ